MKWAINAGSIFGIKLYIHLTFFILLLFVFASNIKEGLEHAFISTLLVCAIFICVVIHELAHSLVARRFGREPRSITLLPIGGVAAIDLMPVRPAQELVISIVGPLTNILIAVILILLFGWQIVAAFRESHPGILAAFIAYLVVANIVLAVFNLIPALPMDGGRVLRSLLALKMDYLKATIWAAAVGKAIAALFIVIGLLRNDLWLAFIGFFVYSGADSEKRQAIAQATFGQAAAEPIADPTAGYPPPPHRRTHQ